MRYGYSTGVDAEDMNDIFLFECVLTVLTESASVHVEDSLNWMRIIH